MQRWLDIVKRDAELMETSGLDIEEIKAKALEVIQEARKRVEISQESKPEPSSDPDESKANASIEPI